MIISLKKNEIFQCKFNSVTKKKIFIISLCFNYYSIYD